MSFQIGDEIVCVSAKCINWYKNGDVHIVRGVPFVVTRDDGDKVMVHVEDAPNDGVYVEVHHFELVETEEPATKSQDFTDDELDWNTSTRTKSKEKMMEDITSASIARPELDTRKADKIRMELFDDGFPNAILEIAKIMTWAQTAKGYKDHDWRFLPDPENSLKGAGSRHRRDANSQKMSGVPAAERVDHESNLHHLAHQAFNILAELELILTGKIV